MYALVWFFLVTNWGRPYVISYLVKVGSKIKFSSFLMISLPQNMLSNLTFRHVVFPFLGLVH